MIAPLRVGIASLYHGVVQFKTNMTENFRQNKTYEVQETKARRNGNLETSKETTPVNGIKLANQETDKDKQIRIRAKTTGKSAAKNQTESQEEKLLKIRPKSKSKEIGDALSK